MLLMAANSVCFEGVFTLVLMFGCSKHFFLGGVAAVQSVVVLCDDAALKSVVVLAGVTSAQSIIVLCDVAAVLVWNLIPTLCFFFSFSFFFLCVYFFIIRASYLKTNKTKNHLHPPALLLWPFWKSSTVKP